MYFFTSCDQPISETCSLGNDNPGNGFGDKHRPSAVALSRNPVPDTTVVAAVQAVSSDFIAEQSSDAERKVFIDYVRDGKLPEDEKAAGRLCCKGNTLTSLMAFFNMKTLCIQEGSVWLYQERGEKALFREAHDSRFVGHFAEKRIYELLRKRYWWP